MPIHNNTRIIIVMPTPTVPTIMPISIVIPSLLSSPSDIISIPQPGGKLVKGKGRDMDNAKTKEKILMILSQVGTLM